MGIETAKESENSRSDLQSDSPQLDDFRLPDLPRKASDKTSEVSTGFSSPEVQSYLQNSMLARLDRRLAQVEGAAGGDEKKTLLESRTALKQELDKGEFGSESKRVYRDFVTNYVNKELRESLLRTVEQTVKLNLDFLPAAPFKASYDESQQLQNRQELVRKLAAGEIPTNLSLNPDRLPDLEQMQGFIDALDWKSRQDLLNTSRSLDNWAGFLSKKIEDSQGRFPSSWQLKDGDDKLAWCLSVEKAMNLRDMVASRIDFWNYAKKMGFYDAPPLPEGVKVQRKPDGEISSIDIPLPHRPQMNEPQALALFKRYENWLSLPEQDLAKSAELLKLINANPLDAVMQGYSPIPAFESGGSRKSPMGVFSKDGQFMYLAAADNPQAKLKPGESLKEISLIKHDTELRQNPDGKIQLVLSKQAMNKDFILGRDWMASPVGKAKVIVSPELSPSAPVFVSNGVDLQAIRADQVKNWVESRKASDMFWETTSTALDLGMLALGGVELLALKGGKMALAAATAEAGNAIAARTFLSGVDRAAKLGVGSLWALDNSRARQSTLVESALTAKSAYIGFDASKNLFLLAKGPSASAVLFNKGIKDTLARTAFLSEIDRAASLSFRVSEIPMTLAIGSDIKHQYMALQNPLEKFNGKMAMSALGDGRGAEKAKAGDFDLSRPEVLNAGKEKLEQYERLLIAGATKKEADEIRKSFAQLRDILSGKINGAGKEAILKSWAGSLAITEPTDRRKLEEANNGPLSSDELGRLFDPEAGVRLSLNKNLRPLAQDILAGRSSAIMNAHALALLYASRDSDGKVPEVLEKFEMEVPAYRVSKVFQTKQGDSTKTIYMPAWQAPRPVTESVGSNRVIRRIEGLLEKAQSNEERVVFGDLLLRTGRISHSQYAQVLLNVLDDKNASRSDKMMALSDASGARLSVLFEGISLSEAVSESKDSRNAVAEIISSFGGRARDIEKTLLQMAKDEPDADMRAMAAALLYGGRRSLLDPEQGRAISRQASDLWQSGKDMAPGSFSERLRLAEILRADLEAASSVKSLQAATFLLETGIDPELSRKEIAKFAAANIRGGQDSSETLAALSLLAGKSLISELDLSEQKRVVDFLISNFEKPAASDAEELTKSELLAVLPSIYKNVPDSMKLQIESSLRRILTEHQDFGLLKNFRFAALSVLDQTEMKERFQPELKRLMLDSRFPELRQKAFSILQGSAHAPDLSKLAGLKRSKETDPLLASQISDLESLAKLKTLTAQEVNTLWTEFSASLDRAISSAPNYPVLRKFNWGEESKFLAEEVFLLDHNTFREEAAKNAGNSWWFLDRLTGNPDKLERDSVQSMLAQREQHWQRLKELASGPDQEKALKARYLLYEIASRNGMPVSRVDTDDYVDTGRQKIPYKNPRSFWEDRAMKALLETLRPATPDRDFSLHLLRMSLSESNPWGSPELRRQQIAAWQRELGKTISHNEYLLVLAAASRAERIKRIRDYDLENQLDKELEAYPGLQAWARETNPKPFFWINRRLP